MFLIGKKAKGLRTESGDFSIYAPPSIEPVRLSSVLRCFTARLRSLLAFRSGKYAVASLRIAAWTSYALIYVETTAKLYGRGKGSIATSEMQPGRPRRNQSTTDGWLLIRPDATLLAGWWRQRSSPEPSVAGQTGDATTEENQTNDTTTEKETKKGLAIRLHSHTAQPNFLRGPLRSVYSEYSTT